MHPAPSSQTACASQDLKETLAAHVSSAIQAHIVTLAFSTIVQSPQVRQLEAACSRTARAVRDFGAQTVESAARVKKTLIAEEVRKPVSVRITASHQQEVRAFNTVYADQGM